MTMNNQVLTAATTPATRRVAAARCVLGSLGVACLAPNCVTAQELSDEWQFGATIYGWFPDIGGNTSLPLGGGGSIDVDIGTILDKLKMTGQGSFEIQKGQWGGFADLVYLDVGDSKSRTRNLEIAGQPLPAGVTAALDLDLKSTIATFAGSYRVVAGPAATFDWLAGARLASLEQTLDWEVTGDFGPVTPPPRTGRRNVSVDQWDAIIGLKGRVALGATHSWVVPYYFDVGAGDSDMTWQAMLALGYTFNWGEVLAAWRYLNYDLTANGPITDLNFNGPALGITFRW